MEVEIPRLRGKVLNHPLVRKYPELVDSGVLAAQAAFWRGRPLIVAHDVLNPHRVVKAMRDEVDELGEALDSGELELIEKEAADVVVFGVSAILFKPKVWGQVANDVFERIEFAVRVGEKYGFNPFREVVRVVNGKNARNYPPIMFQFFASSERVVNEVYCLAREGVRRIRYQTDEGVLPGWLNMALSRNGSFSRGNLSEKELLVLQQAEELLARLHGIGAVSRLAFLDL